MADSILREYLEELPEQEPTWKECQHRLAGWHRFNTFLSNGPMKQ